MELEKIKSKTIEMILKFSIPSIVAMVLYEDKYYECPHQYFS